MSHADTLRGMAKAFMMVGSHERVDTCLAGADALETLDRVGNLAHAVDEQDKTIQALSRLLAGAEKAATERAEQIERLQRAVNYAVINSLQDAFDLVVDGVLHPEDMEAPE